MVYDKADFNTRSIDGYNNYYVIGRTYTIAPATLIPIWRSFGAVNLKHFESKENSDILKVIKIQDLWPIHILCNNIFVYNYYIIWLYMSKDFELSLVP